MYTELSLKFDFVFEWGRPVLLRVGFAASICAVAVAATTTIAVVVWSTFDAAHGHRFTDNMNNYS